MCALGKSVPLSTAPKVDAEGFLCQLTDWNPEVAQYLAAQEGLSLTAAHWEVIELVRQFYQRFELSPAMRPLNQYLRQYLPPNKTGSIYLMQLFGQSPAKSLARLAGLPKPDNCL